MAASKVSLKLLIDKNENKVLFAEAGKDFIDVLFSLMPMSLAAVSSVLLTKNSMVGSLGNLYHSIDTLSDSYFQTNQAKEYLLKTNTPTMLYCCPNVDEDEDDDEDEDYNPDKDEDDGDEDEDDDDEYDDEDEGEGEDEDECGGTGGFVKAVVKYMVMDDLVVSPMSTISTITLLNKFGVKGIDALEERVVELGMDEGIKLLKESLQSQTVLTSIFLRN